MNAPNKIPESKKSRTVATLWLIAAACSLTAAVLTYSSDHQVKWALLAAAVFMAALGVTKLRSSTR